MVVTRSPASPSVRFPAQPAPSGLDSVAAWALVALVATLSLEWVTLRGVGTGFVKPFHLAALTLAAAAMARWRAGDLLVPVLARHGSIYWSYAVVLVMTAASALAHTAAYQSPSSVGRQAGYAAASVLVAGVVAKLVTIPRAGRILAMSGLVTVAVVTGGLFLSLAAQGTNPVPVFARAVAEGDPNLITNQVFQQVFRSNLDLAEVGSNLRHKVFAAVAMGTFVGLSFLPAVAGRRRQLALGLGGMAGGVLVVASLSRSAIVILAIPLALAPLRSLVRGRARPGQVVVAVVIGAGLMAAAASPVADLLSTRFATSGSYEARLEALGPGFLSVAVDAALIGLPKDAGVRSPHNLVLNAWLSGGVVAAAAAAVILVALARRWAHLLRSYLVGSTRTPHGLSRLWLLGLGALPLVRAFTAGNQYHLVEWTAIAFFLALSGPGAVGAEAVGAEKAQ